MNEPGFLKKHYHEIVKRDGNRCVYCGRTPIYPAYLSYAGNHHKEMATIDHVIPKCKGGTDDLDNLVLACWACNVRKGTREVLHLECGG